MATLTNAQKKEALLRVKLKFNRQRLSTGTVKKNEWMALATAIDDALEAAEIATAQGMSASDVKSWYLDSANSEGARMIIMEIARQRREDI
ncbi:MAG: hypothetical protein VXB01_02595 [Opitutae bacterium]